MRPGAATRNFITPRASASLPQTNTLCIRITHDPSYTRDLPTGERKEIALASLWRLGNFSVKIQQRGVLAITSAVSCRRARRP